MKNIYYDVHEFEQALGISGVSPKLSLVRLEKYVQKYPKDYDAKTMYISLLIQLRQMDKAEETLVKLENDIETDVKYQKYKEKKIKTYCNLMFCKVKLLYYQNKYQECYDLMIDNLPVLLEHGMHFEPTALVCQKKLGTLNRKINPETDGYLFSQIIDYSDDRFLEHIKKHSITDDLSDSEKTTSIFKEDFPVEKVFKEIKKNVPSNLKIYNGLIEDLYIYRYDFCGKCNNKNTDYFKVIAIHDTSDFITMCPCVESKYWDYLDLNYLREEKPKQKKISQIDKFNQRYNKTIDKL